ncbi:hypothetical protein K505DRAFT_342972 [Melanomma pulvis-pyrius CBS 109.77]|uniref:Rhodopsin domain-containing protein n=1 Tax=Melanomma pulvis-pyrius CBS 109.77 TaxID=1314802 RepID=A0A6A6WUJ1_9PLEO|nr:hypothetical protein K505DRAFT_342972 [Melanomma pulvis-pyrius CBS 109.77]
MFIRSGFVVVIVGFTLTSLSTIIVALRYYCRYFRMGSVGVTDHLMLTALLLTWGNTTINFYQDTTSSKFRPSQFRFPVSIPAPQIRLGQFLITLQEKRPMIEAALRGTLVTWWMYRITYGIALCFVKLSILYFYRAIASHATFRRMVHITIGFVCLYTFASTIASIFQCENPSDAWSTTAFLSQFDGVKGRTKPPKCYDPTRLYLFTATINLFTDVVILLLPIPTLLGLRVPMSKRLALIGIFSVGLLAIVASCVRMWVMALWSQSPEKSAQFGADLLLWGQVETNSGIISASVPFLRLIFGRREKEPEEKRRVVVPPRPIPTDNKPLRIDSLKFFTEPDLGPNGSPVWEPFITVPASLSSGSRGSAMLEPTRPHLTV